MVPKLSMDKIISLTAVTLHNDIVLLRRKSFSTSFRSVIPVHSTAITRNKIRTEEHCNPVEMLKLASNKETNE